MLQQHMGPDWRLCQGQAVLKLGFCLWAAAGGCRCRHGLSGWTTWLAGLVRVAVAATAMAVTMAAATAGE